MGSKQRLEIGDLVKINEDYLTSENLFYLPYNENSIGLVIDYRKSSYYYHPDLDNFFGSEYFVVVRWTGLVGEENHYDDFYHTERELIVIAKARSI